jgi:teichuronic acid biosynthesis glycosyltransferase TuaC
VVAVVFMRGIIPERYGRGVLRALVLSNMLPDRAHPERGRFVRDQVRALRALGDVDVELHEFPPGPGALARAARDLRRSHGRPSILSRRPASAPIDVVHAHFGLTAWPALAVPARVRALTMHGTDLSHPRTRLATALVLPLMHLPAVVSEPLLAEVPGARARRRAQVLPCGVDTDRFQPMDRRDARSELGIDPDRPFLLFPADPSRPEKRHDRVAQVAELTGAEVLTLGGVEPERVPLLVNASNAVLVPSEREGFGLAVLEALACDVPVIATPVGVHAEALAGIAGSVCAPFDPTAWADFARAQLEAGDPRTAGRAAAERYSAAVMAERVLRAWERAVQQSG